MTLVFQAIWLVPYLRLMDNVRLPGGVDNKTMAGVNSCFAVVTENDILRMHDTTIPNDIKKVAKLEMKCLLSRSPSFADASLLEQQLSFHGSISKSHPSQLNFHWAKRLYSRKFECRYLSLKWSWFPTLQAWFPKETLPTVLSISVISSKLQLPSRSYFKVLITLTAILSGQL